MVLAAKPKKPTSIHHKKRTGHHHKRDKAYHKSYWPYIPMLAVVLVGFAINLLWAPNSGGVLAYATNMSVNGLLAETNEERAAAGQGNLTINQQLMNAAQAKANDMAARNYWSHVTPDGKQPWWFVTSAGYDYQATGENLAYGFDNSSAAVTGWMNSPGHKANLLNAVYQDVGFGIANSEDYQGYGQQTIVVAMYGKATTGTTTAAAATPAPTPSVASNQPATATPSPSPSETPAQTPAPAAASTPKQQKLALAQTIPANPAVLDDYSQPVSRLELMAAGVSPVTVFITTIIIAIAAAVFILRHMYFWHRAVVKGEAFLIRHWKSDVIIVAIITFGVLLTRTAGFIQ